MENGRTTVLGVIKGKLSEASVTVIEKIKKKPNTEPGTNKTFKRFLPWLSNKDVVSKLEAQQKLEFFHHKGEVVRQNIVVPYPTWPKFVCIVLGK